MFFSRRKREDGDVIKDENGVIRRKDTSPGQPPRRPVQIEFSEEEAEARRGAMLGAAPFVSRSNRVNGDVIMDENGVIRRRDTPPGKFPKLPVQLWFSEEEAEARRRAMGVYD